MPSVFTRSASSTPSTCVFVFEKSFAGEVVPTGVDGLVGVVDVPGLVGEFEVPVPGVGVVDGSAVPGDAVDWGGPALDESSPAEKSDA
ncbi:MAG: hypothetical protein U0169_26280 [Polyangiaceae bacterium]